MCVCVRVCACVYVWARASVCHFGHSTVIRMSLFACVCNTENVNMRVYKCACVCLLKFQLCVCHVISARVEFP